MRIFFLIVTLFCMHTCLGQHGLIYDSSKTTVRSISAEQMKAYQADDQFQYNKYKEPPRSLWDRFWNWFWSKIGELLSSRGGSAAFKIVLTLLAVALLAFFIYKFTGMNKAGLFKRNTGDALGYSVTEEDIHSIDFDQAINHAIDNQHYRLAVRLLYLQSLKRLADRNLINWQLNKTNIAYVQELEGRSFQPFFGNLTLQFENNWYGDMPIDVTGFNIVREQFNQFNQIVK